MGVLLITRFVLTVLMIIGCMVLVLLFLAWIGVLHPASHAEAVAWGRLVREVCG